MGTCVMAKTDTGLESIQPAVKDNRERVLSLGRKGNRQQGPYSKRGHLRPRMSTP